MKTELVRTLRYTIKTVNPETGGAVIARHYDFNLEDVDMSLEDMDRMDHVEEWVRRETLCKTRTVKAWIDAIEKLVPEDLIQWVASIVWFDYVSREKTTKETEFFEEKYVAPFKLPEDDWDGELVAALEALEYPTPNKRIYGPKAWDEFYDEVRERLEIRLNLRANQRKKMEKLA
jgi:hypothetical protein